LRILFAGSPSIALPSLNAISTLEMEGRGITLAGILTNPDSPRGRRGEIIPTDISAHVSELDRKRAEKGLHPIPQLKPQKLDSEARRNIAALNADLLVSFAYGRIFGPLFMSLFPMGGINIHPSLLPKYRGASPLQAAILAGDKETGVAIQKIDREMDAGDILSVKTISLNGRETLQSLGEIAADTASVMLMELLLNFKEREAAAVKQDGDISYCYQIKKENGLINWEKNAHEIDAQIRAYNPWPLSFTYRENDLLYILEAHPVPDNIPNAKASPGMVLGSDKEHGIMIQTGNGLLAVKQLQYSGKKALDWRSFLNGARNFTGSQLGGRNILP